MPSTLASFDEHRLHSKHLLLSDKHPVGTNYSLTECLMYMLSFSCECLASDAGTVRILWCTGLSENAEQATALDFTTPLFPRFGVALNLQSFQSPDCSSSFLT